LCGYVKCSKKKTLNQHPPTFSAVFYNDMTRRLSCFHVSSLWSGGGIIVKDQSW